MNNSFPRDLELKDINLIPAEFDFLEEYQKHYEDETSVLAIISSNKYIPAITKNNINEIIEYLIQLKEFYEGK